VNLSFQGAHTFKVGLSKCVMMTPQVQTRCGVLHPSVGVLMISFDEVMYLYEPRT